MSKIFDWDIAYQRMLDIVYPKRTTTDYDLTLLDEYDVTQYGQDIENPETSNKGENDGQGKRRGGSER